MQKDDLIGTMLGNYRVLAPVGQGGMARVYRAHQENLDREVAIKVLPPWFAADRSFVERFNLEARLVARLSHPNIVTVHDADEQNGNLYIVMQLVDGGTLKNRTDHLRSQRRVMDVTEATRIYSQLASALNYAHEAGIIHRDIKPVNVLMDRSGRPILSDFGIAKAMAGGNNEQLTRPGAGVGTPEYMSPEQCHGKSVDARTDIYALGVMLFETLTGRTPFTGDNYPALAHSHIYEQPPLPSVLNPLIQPPVEKVIMTALQKNPQMRYQSASAMAAALEQAVMASKNVSFSMNNIYGALPSAPRMTPPITGMSGKARAYPTQIASAICRTCQSRNKLNMKFCTRCGSPLNYCPACGNQNPAPNRFCTRCGGVLTPAAVINSQ